MENAATQTSEVSKYQLISQLKLDKFHVAVLQQMFELTTARFHAATQTFLKHMRYINHFETFKLL